MIFAAVPSACGNYAGIQSDQQMAQPQSYETTQGIPSESGHWPAAGWADQFGDVLWDMDGTLADSEALHLSTLVAVLTRYGIEAGDDLHASIFGKTGREVHAYCWQRFGIDFDYGQWSMARARHYLSADRHDMRAVGSTGQRGQDRGGAARSSVWGEVDALVGTTLFLISPASAFITGVTLPVDGGYATGV